MERALESTRALTQGDELRRVLDELAAAEIRAQRRAVEELVEAAPWTGRETETWTGARGGARRSS